MKFSDSAQEVEAEYQKRYGKGSAEDEDEASIERIGDSKGTTDVDGEGNDNAISKGKEVEVLSAKIGDEKVDGEGDGEGEGDDDGEDEGDDDDEEEDEEDKHNGAKNFALSRRVTIAKELFANKSPEAQAAIQTEAEEHYNSRHAAYEKALAGEDWYDADLLLEYVLFSLIVCVLTFIFRRRKNAGTFAQPLADSYSAMVKGMVSICVVGLDEPETPGEEPKLFLHQWVISSLPLVLDCSYFFRSVMSKNMPRKFADWDPKSFKEEHMGSLLRFASEMYRIQQGLFCVVSFTLQFFVLQNILWSLIFCKIFC